MTKSLPEQMRDLAVAAMHDAGNQSLFEPLVATALLLRCYNNLWGTKRS
jgi:hypothetical protein